MNNAHMEMRHLKLVKAIAETKSVTKAATELFLTQSALSHQLRELQNIYNNPVFTRINKEMVPTRIGERLIQTSLNILDEIEQNDRDIKCLITGDSGELRISTQCYTFYHWLSPILASFKKAYKNIDVKIVPEATYNTVGFLKEGKLDLAILHTNPRDRQILLRELFEDELVLILSPEHRLAKKKFVVPRDLLEETYITYALPQGTGYGLTFSKLFGKGPIPEKIVKVALTEAIFEMVKTNLGIAIVANWAVEPYAKSGKIVRVPVTKNGTRRKWFAATLKKKTADPTHVEHFIDAIIKCRLNS
jgi:LysR family transcriptional regulator for metE and metH